ncbi:MAG: peroxidase [Planctomycetes bacterium]|nr:peroxidase [Planctomycetota bacterium]
MRDPANAPLPPADAALVTYALKLTRTPGAMDASDVLALRAHGFDDRAIHDLCAVTAYFAFVNRIADGLGVELES